MSMAELPASFWDYALETAAYILNRVPTKSVPHTPYELWTGRKPGLSHMQVWGCIAHVARVDPKKLEPRSRPCHFIGYPKLSKGYTFYDPLGKRSLIAAMRRFWRMN